MSRYAHAICLRSLYTFAYTFALLLGITVSAMGQSSGSAAISGVVVDTSDARIADAKVSLMNTDTGIGNVSVSGKDGGFSIPSVPPGHYELQVARQDFETVVINGIVLNVGDNKNLVVRMKIGSSNQTVTVDGSGITINTTDASVSTVIDRQFVENLPLNGRSFQSLLYITPGVNLNVSAGSSLLSQGQFVVNGQRGDASYWMIDGVSANIGIAAAIPGTGFGGAVGAGNALGGTSALVSVDALQEFRIETSTYAPEFGREPGGQISIQTRSGTNQFHGTVFDYLRNTDLDAKDWFADHYGLAKTAEIQNDFGGVIGGPILKDKTFFFLSLEGLRLILPSTFFGMVPDANARKIAIPSVQPYLNAYPVPAPGVADVPGLPGMAPYSATYSEPNHANAYSLRIDHQLARNLNFFARYNHAPSKVEQRGPFAITAANDIINIDAVTKTATAGLTWTQSASIVDDLRFNYSVSGNNAVFSTDSFGGGSPFPGQGLFPSPYTYSHGGILIFAPLFGTNTWEYDGTDVDEYQHQYNLIDTLSVQRGAHSFKFGVDYRRLSPSHFPFIYELLPFFSAPGNLEAGESSETVIVSSCGPSTDLLHNLSLYGQDTWRISSRFNLTYGLRWDVDFYPTSETGPGLPAITGYSLTNLSNLALAPTGAQAWSTRYGNVAPRIGGAYKLSTDPNWGRVLRGGFGVFYGLADTEIANAAFAGGTYPFYGNKFQFNVAFPTTPLDAAPVPITPPNIQNGNTLLAYDPHLNVPYALEWNVAVEQSIGSAQSFTLSYIGASDGRTLLTESINNPNANYASTELIGNLGTLNYNALQAQFQRRLTNGLQALIAYSWSHSIDTGSYGAYSNGSFANPNANRGDSDYDLRNVFTAALTYNPPEWKRNTLTRAITGGWSTDDIIQIRSGPPVDVDDNNFAALSHQNASVLIRPDVVPGQPKYLTGSQYPGRKEINPASFRDPPVDPVTHDPIRQGDLGRNSRRALGLEQWDFGARREFPIYERLKLQFRAELFNIFNHPNFGPFNNSFLTGNIQFGQATQMLNQFLGTNAIFGAQNPLYTPGGPRSGELALKLVF